jgi:hypothetical protein
MSSTGIPVNNGMLFDAVLFKGDNAQIKPDSSYLNGKAVYSNMPGTVLINTPKIPAGELSGDMVLTIMWDSSSSSTWDLLVQIIKDGVHERELIFMHEDSVNDFGTAIIHKFNSKSEYSIRIQSTTASEIYLDYIKFTQVFPGSIISATRRVINEQECIEVVDRGTTTVVGTGAATADKTIYFNAVFNEPPTLDFTVHNHLFKPSIVSKSVDRCVVRLVDVNLGTFSDSVNVDWVAHGSVIPPFAPALPI